ncbi:MAG: helix-turn-helix transcriptional regulator [Leptospira sp.]|nr:helix-turn-helix transcriptional regulator [Leptospira sp.]
MWNYFLDRFYLSRFNEFVSKTATVQKRKPVIAKSSFAIRLRDLRSQKNISQAELAEAISVHKNNIVRYENGAVEPTAETLRKLSQFFSVSTDFLLEGISENGIKVNFQDKELLNMFQKTEKLSEKDKSTVKELLDAFLAKKQITEIVNK